MSSTSPRRGAVRLLAMSFLGIVAAGVALANGPIPASYLLPLWYTGKLEAKVSGSRVLVKGRLQPNLAAMRKVLVRLETGKGLSVVSSSAIRSAGQAGHTTGATGSQTRPGQDPAAGTVENSLFEGDLPAGGSIDFEAVLEPTPGIEHAFVTLVFEYDFPTSQILSYIDLHKSDLYPDPKLRERLVATVNQDHKGRKTEGLTERVELGGGGH